MDPKLRELWATKRALIQQRSKLVDKIFFLWRKKLQEEVKAIDLQIDEVTRQITEAERR